MECIQPIGSHCLNRLKENDMEEEEEMKIIDQGEDAYHSYKWKGVAEKCPYAKDSEAYWYYMEGFARGRGH